MWHAEKTYARVDQAVSDGELWRAKEILQGNIGVQEYLPELYERYGEVLLQMGDLVEAGKYLFLSGVRLPEYERAISLYWARYTRRGPACLYRSFPSKAKLTTLDDYPEPVRGELAALGLPRQLRSDPTPAPKSSVVSLLIGVLLLLLLLASVGVGLIVIVKWAISLVAG